MTAINPLIEDLSKLKDAEVENKIQDLSIFRHLQRRINY